MHSFIRRPKGKGIFGRRTRSRRILLKSKEDLIGTAWSWIKVESDAGFVNIATNFQVSKKQRYFLTRWATIKL
jgi:hypothetical protein